MKKLISLSLSAMLALGLAACSGQSDELVLTMGELALPDSSEATVDTYRRPGGFRQPGRRF